MEAVNQSHGQHGIIAVSAGGGGRWEGCGMRVYGGGAAGGQMSTIKVAAGSLPRRPAWIS
jgi:hypothetical protein